MVRKLSLSMGILFFATASHAGFRFGLGKAVAENAREAIESSTSTSTYRKPKGTRVIGMDILSETPSSNFTNNIMLAKEAGAEAMIFNLPWNEVESDGTHDCTLGSYEDPYGGALATFNTTLPAQQLKLSLGVNPLSTNIWDLPSIYSSSDFTADSSLPATQSRMDEMACRFNNMLDYVFSQIPEVEIVSLQIGNEIDLPTAVTDVDYWANYFRFYAQVAAHARTIRTPAVSSAMKIGVTGTAYGLSGAIGAIQKDGMKILNDNISDMVVFTYYPQDENYQVKDPSVVRAELAQLIAIYPTRQFYANEVGYQSGSVYDGSSEDKQASFMTHIFQVWDTYSDRIPFLSFLRFNDLSHAEAQSLAEQYVTPAPPALVEYLETLGLLTYPGRQKPAYAQLKSETVARGW